LNAFNFSVDQDCRPVFEHVQVASPLPGDRTKTSGTSDDSGTALQVAAAEGLPAVAGDARSDRVDGARLTALRHTGLKDQEKLPVILLVGNFVRGEATLAADLASVAEGAAAGATEAEAAGQAIAAYGAIMMQAITPERFPAVHAVMLSGALEDDNDSTLEGEFGFGPTRILDGVDVLVRSRRSRPGGGFRARRTGR
jgi:hypothetical protein